MRAESEIDPGIAQRGRQTIHRAVERMSLIVVILVLWQIASVLVGEDALPAPINTGERLWSIMSDAEFAGHIWETGRAFMTALVLSTIGGLIAGLVLGAHRLSGEIAEPLLLSFYTIPKVTLYPIILLLFGLGISARVAFGVIHGIIPITVFTMNAVRNLPPIYFRSANAMRLSTSQIAWTIVVPATMPELISGFRLGFSLTLLGTLIGEMFASQRGLGYLMVKAMETGDNTTVMALAVLLIVMATIASTALLALERRLHGSITFEAGT
jgi:NitT/TauT family transport system permease protein